MEEAWGSEPLRLLLEESSELIKIPGTIKQGTGMAVTELILAVFCCCGQTGRMYNEEEMHRGHANKRCSQDRTEKACVKGFDLLLHVSESSQSWDVSVRSPYRRAG